MDCLFCKIVNGDIPSTKVFENENVLAFRDISPQAPVHIVLIPKEHYATVLDIPGDSKVMNEILNAVKEIAKAKNYTLILDTNTVIYTANETTDDLSEEVLKAVGGTVPAKTETPASK